MNEQARHDDLNPAAWSGNAGIQCIGLFLAGIALALLPRIGLLAESLWVDELHTAWVVDADWRQVADRAARGNQSPWYFFGVKLLTTLTGANEWGLRLPSVLATALAAGISAVCLWRWTGRIVFALGAACVMSLDGNAVFFGTEARPYACVLLATLGVCVACGSALRRAWEPQSSKKSREILHYVAVGICTTMAILMHVTAGLAVSVIVLAFVAAAWGNRERRYIVVPFVVAWATGALGALLLNVKYVVDVWERRGQWSAFGSTDNLVDVWVMWPWAVYFLLPAGILLVRMMIKHGPALDRTQATLATVLMAAAVAGTLASWCVAYTDIAPVWHRRFLIGLLSPLALASTLLWSLAFGAKVGQSHDSPVETDQQAFGRQRALHNPVLLSIFGLATLVIATLYSQGTLSRWLSGRYHWLDRGEGWREAVQWIAIHVDKGEPIYVDAELLESAALRGTGAAPGVEKVDREYLLYPVRSIYHREHAIPLGPIETWPNWIDGLAGQDAETWILVRKRSAVVSAHLENWQTTADSREVRDRFWESELFAFGNVTVVRFSARQLD